MPRAMKRPLPRGRTIPAAAIARAKELVAKHGRDGYSAYWRCGVEKTGKRDLVDAMAAEGMSDGQVAAVMNAEEGTTLTARIIQHHTARRCRCFTPRTK